MTFSSATLKPSTLASPQSLQTLRRSSRSTTGSRRMSGTLSTGPVPLNSKQMRMWHNTSPAFPLTSWTTTWPPRWASPSPFHWQRSTWIRLARRRFLTSGLRRVEWHAQTLSRLPPKPGIFWSSKLHVATWSFACSGPTSAPL
jgi:hypothetical protein